MSEKILIIGANGLIGRAVTKELKNDYLCVGTTHSRLEPAMLRCDITNPLQVQEVFKQVKPRYVMHCANLAGGLDFYEKHPDLTKKFHYEATISIGRQCLKYDSKLLFISSECVFDGKKEVYAENDVLNPLNIYGKYKAESEKWIQKNLKDYIIVRTMSVYGWDPLTVTPNAVMKVYFSISKGEQVFVPTFRWGNPTYVKDVANALYQLYLYNETGIFHVAGTSFISRYEWLKKTCNVLGWDSSLVIPQERPSENDFLRPLRISLSTEKFQKKFNIKLHNLAKGLSLLKQDVEENSLLKIEFKNE